VFSWLGIDSLGPVVRPFEFPGLRVRHRVAITPGADTGLIRRRHLPTYVAGNLLPHN
jgi:hypothetical protein